ncbi:LysR family transcriptional regulator [Cohnella xylanilytica]|uniref:LysR family transcriptional regulator n=1 Tax=Cohnella xylanilytica TaxID=557555 RepID=A0A841TZ22_9BACL|nr:LysR family transcriptional regulator [Cohnella xylanilytica]MBB6693526.1 LysR family transcriptional regulator [Cohnella xylanilytica]
MDFRTLKTFHTIVNTGNYHKAAEELQYVQSTITMQIQKLEADLGVKLLERGRKNGIRLTDAGRLFYDKAAQLIKEYEGVKSALADWKHGDAGTVRLGVVEPAASYRLPLALTAFYRQYPKIDVSVQIGNTQALIGGLLKGELDLLLCTPPETGFGTIFEPLFAERVALLVPAGHRLASWKRPVRVADLRHERLLMTSAVCPYRNKLESALTDRGASPYHGIEITSTTALKHYVQAGYGVAVVPVVTVDPVPEGTVLKTVADLDADLVTGILKRADRTTLGAAGEKLMLALRRELGAVGEERLQSERSEAYRTV